MQQDSWWQWVYNVLIEIILEYTLLKEGLPTQDKLKMQVNIKTS